MNLPAPKINVQPSQTVHLPVESESKSKRNIMEDVA